MPIYDLIELVRLWRQLTSVAFCRHATAQLLNLLQTSDRYSRYGTGTILKSTSSYWEKVAFSLIKLALLLLFYYLHDRLALNSTHIWKERICALQIYVVVLVRRK